MDSEELGFPRIQGAVWTNIIERAIPKQLRQKERIPYFATVEWDTIGASATSTQTLVVDADASLVLLGANAVDVASADRNTRITFMNYLITLKSTASGREITNIATHLENMVGMSDQIFYWPMPLYLPAASSLQTTLQNLRAAAHVVRLTFYGFKIVQ